ncbi:hypothetical protein MAC_01979 [Metarhizium acridum CQMa 102]|uniref:Amidohydrolase-related domain-containing protein n=2 Tax=Metarhizium acridum TaxID=92637 RepID=E9DWI1_METAQ|nr:uncharacterized protein MAC_01979 [Metarhizium acridum CQMa 102]EFY92031.1 hypothetical protein MAC_01979 [Metarhizium acridum CQMa 102]
MTIRKAPITAMASHPATTGSCAPDADMDMTRSANKKIPDILVKPWKLPPQKTYIFQNANVVDSASGSVHQKQTIKLAQVRDTGGATLALKEAIEDDVFPGPRLFISNKALSQTGGHGDMRGVHDKQKCCGGDSALTTVVDGVPGCIQATREQLRTGADFIKIMAGGGVASPTDKLENTQFTAAEIQAIAEVADTYGTYVTAHAYTPKAIRHAVDNGARYMARKGIRLTPTIVTYDAMGSDKYADFLPPANRAKNEMVLSKGLESLRIAEEAGVTICHGSDLLGPLHEEQSREFGIRAQALSSKTVLQGATVNAAKLLRQDKFLGQIRKGFAADLLILNGNPLDNVAILDEPEKTVLAVIKNGRVYASRWGQLPRDIASTQNLIE